MKNPQESTMAQSKQSERLAAQIHEVASQHAALQDELGAIDRRLDLLAAADELDQHAVADCQARRQTVLGESDFLTRRLGALQAKKGDAEHEEAGQRLQQIVAEVEHLVESETPALEAYA